MGKLDFMGVNPEMVYHLATDLEINLPYVPPPSPSPPYPPQVTPTYVNDNNSSNSNSPPILAPPSFPAASSSDPTSPK